MAPAGAALLLVALALALASCAHAVQPSTIDDVAITTRVKTAILNDARLGTLPIDVRTAHGIVELSGSVRSEEEAALAVRLARGVSGVRDVISTLAVRAG